MPADPAGRDATAPEVEAVARALHDGAGGAYTCGNCIRTAEKAIAALDEYRAGDGQELYRAVTASGTPIKDGVVDPTVGDRLVPAAGDGLVRLADVVEFLNAQVGVWGELAAEKVLAEFGPREGTDG